jgi:putative MATE family efflux protein
MKLRISTRTIWTISLPLILAGANETIVEVTDTVFLARYGMVEVGAVAIAAALYEVVCFLIFGLGDGVQIICARRAGQDDEHGLGQAFNQGLALLLGTSVVLFMVIAFAAPVATGWILASTEVKAAVDGFLGIVAFAVFFDALNIAYSAFYVGLGRTRVLIGATAALAVTNIALDYVLIFGHFGAPELGIRGAAIASLCAEIVTFLFLTAYAVRQGDIRRFGLFRMGWRNGALTRVVMSVSWPVAIESLVGAARWFLFFLIVERMGEAPLASANIVYSVYALFLLPVDGFSETTMTMVSNVIGQDDGSRIGGVVRRAMVSTSALVLPFALLVLALPDAPLALFTSDPVLIEGSRTSLRVVAVAVLILIPAEIVFAAVAGTGDTRSTLFIETALSTTVLAWVWVAAIVAAQPLSVVWAGEIVGWTVCLLLSLLWLKSERWKRMEI